jgi:hypothetical protein
MAASVYVALTAEPSSSQQVWAGACVNLTAVHTRVRQGLIPRPAARRLRIKGLAAETSRRGLRDSETSQLSDVTDEAAPPAVR